MHVSWRLVSFEVVELGLDQSFPYIDKAERRCGDTTRYMYLISFCSRLTAR